MSFVNEIDDVVYILTVLSFFIFIGCYYLFRTLSLSFYYTHYCKILLYYIIYYIVNTQLILVAASFLQLNYLSIYLTCIASFNTFLSFICGILRLETCFTSRCWSWEGNRRWSGKRSSQGIVKHHEGTRRESGEVCQQESKFFVCNSVTLWPLHSELISTWFQSWFLIIYQEPKTFIKNCVLFSIIYTN